MTYIKRKRYLDMIRPFVDQPVIKVLTGMRRVGKSTLLAMIREELLAQVPQENIIAINLESGKYLDLRDDRDFYRAVRDQIGEAQGKLYFFFDEVQLVPHWERVINSLRVDYDCDIYVTGSNSILLSGQLPTLLSGRYITFEVYPFSFQEFTELYADLGWSREDLFRLYLEIGGMPSLQYFHGDKQASFKALTDIYNTVVVRDVLQYYQIRDIDLFHRILRYAMQNVGQTFSANSIRKYFLSEGRQVSVDTILNYLHFCEEAFLLKSVRRYDAVGKRLLRVDEKYYLNDHGFRQANGFSNLAAIERVLENIVYIELCSRGYQVQVGRLGDREIDFIAQDGDRLAYFQVAYLLASETTREREFSVYAQIQDNFPKYVLSLDTLDFSQDGIRHLNLIDFLLGAS